MGNSKVLHLKFIGMLLNGYPAAVMEVPEAIIINNTKNQGRSVKTMQRVQKRQKNEDAQKVAMLVAKLNQYRHEYYNKAKPGVSDAVYDLHVLFLYRASPSGFFFIISHMRYFLFVRYNSAGEI